jgi:hypothetical protein
MPPPPPVPKKYVGADVFSVVGERLWGRQRCVAIVVGDSEDGLREPNEDDCGGGSV